MSRVEFFGEIIYHLVALGILVFGAVVQNPYILAVGATLIIGGHLSDIKRDMRKWVVEHPVEEEPKEEKGDKTYLDEISRKLERDDDTL